MAIAKIISLGGITIAQWPTEGYEINESKAVQNDKRVGLALDKGNQPELTKTHIAN